MIDEAKHLALLDALAAFVEAPPPIVAYLALARRWTEGGRVTPRSLAIARGKADRSVPRFGDPARGVLQGCDEVVNWSFARSRTPQAYARDAVEAYALDRSRHDDYMALRGSQAARLALLDAMLAEIGRGDARSAARS